MQYPFTHVATNGVTIKIERHEWFYRLPLVGEWVGPFPRSDKYKEEEYASQTANH